MQAMVQAMALMDDKRQPVLSSPHVGFGDRSQLIALGCKPLLSAEPSHLPVLVCV